MDVSKISKHLESISELSVERFNHIKGYSGLLTVPTVILDLPVHLRAFDLDCGVARGSGHTFNNGWIISKASCAEMTEKP